MTAEAISRSPLGRGTRPSLGQALEQLPVLLDDATKTRLELRVFPAPLDRLAEGDLHGLVEALSLGSRQCLRIGS